VGNDLQRRLLEMGMASYAGTWSAVGPAERFAENERHWGAKPGRPCIAVTDAFGPLVTVRPRTTSPSDQPGFLPHQAHPESCSESCIVTKDGWIALRIALPVEKQWVRDHLSCIESDERVLEAVAWVP